MGSTDQCLGKLMNGRHGSHSDGYDARGQLVNIMATHNAWLVLLVDAPAQH